MNKPDRGITVEELSEKLPSGWDVTIYPEGIIVGYAPSSALSSNGLSAEFMIWPEGDLWTVIWWPSVSSQERFLEYDLITALEERCIEWIAEKAGSE